MTQPTEPQTERHEFKATPPLTEICGVQVNGRDCDRGRYAEIHNVPTPVQRHEAPAPAQPTPPRSREIFDPGFARAAQPTQPAINAVANCDADQIPDLATDDLHRWEIEPHYISDFDVLVTNNDDEAREAILQIAESHLWDENEPGEEHVMKVRMNDVAQGARTPQSTTPPAEGLPPSPFEEWWRKYDNPFQTAPKRIARDAWDAASRRTPEDEVEKVLREINKMVSIDRISTNAHDWASTLIDIRELTDKVRKEKRK